jgi:hypothetical protein
MAAPPPAQTQSPLGPSATVNYGIPDTSQGATFMLEEQAAASARGQSFASLWSGFTLPPALAGDFWQMYSQAEAFAANTGWKYLPTPQQLVFLVDHGFATADSLTQFQALANTAGILQKMPWAGLGMSQTQYSQSKANMGDSLYGLTGHTDFTAAGLGSIQDQAMIQNWSSQQLSDYILQNPALKSQYGYLGYGYNYNTYQAYKTTNATALKQRYGTQFTDANAIQSIADPQTALHAQGGAFGEFAPYTQSQTTMQTGRQSAVR